MCHSQQAYEASGNEKKVLYAMCIGLNHNGSPLFSFDNEPWSKLSKDSLVRPNNTDLGKEVSRRALLYNIMPVPRPRNWNRGQIMEWLEQNAIGDEKCMEFLTNEVSRLRVVLERDYQHHQAATGAEGALTNTGGGGGRNWRGPVPYL